MSVENLVLAAIVEEGNPKKAFRSGISRKDFNYFEDEWEWVVGRYERGKKINRRLFLERFDDFEYVVPKENLEDLFEELKSERAYSQVYSLIESVSEVLLPENSIEQAELMREILSDIVKSYSPHSEISVTEHGPHYERVRQNRIMAKRGLPMGMPLMIPSLDFHWDGLVPGRLYGLLGRPGEGKSFFISWVCWAAILGGYRVGLFSPEMNEFEHINRLHTLASAHPMVQKECGLTKPFKNRDLMRGTGFSMKEYKNFCEFFDTLPGKCEIFTRKYRKLPMTPAYIASRVEDLGLNGVIADPLSKIETMRRKDNPVWEMQDKVHQFQALGEENNIWTMASNWSNRAKGSRDDAPDLDESFGSDALAQEADHILGVKNDPEDGILTLRCSKSRFGQNKFRVYIDFDPNKGKWAEQDIKPDVMQYRIGLNGHTPSNGNTVIKMKTNKVSNKTRKKVIKKAAKKAVAK